MLAYDVQVSQHDVVENLMIPFEEIRPLAVDDEVGKVVMRFFLSDCIPVVDARGSCVGVAYAADCKEVDRSSFSSPLDLIILLHFKMTRFLVVIRWSTYRQCLCWQRRWELVWETS